MRDVLAGLLIGGSLGVFLNAYGPLRDGAWLKMARAVASGAPAAALGGALGLVAGEVVIGLLRGGLLGRALSWAVLGLGIGLGQGIADRSRDRLVYGLIGGGLGGFLGGFLFEWLRVALGDRHDLGQAVGIVTMGAGLGLCLALVEQVLRRAWVQVLNGRQEGRIYLLVAPAVPVGLDERAEIGIFGDASVARRHAEIESTSGGYVLHDLAAAGSTRVNGTPSRVPSPSRRRSDRAGTVPCWSSGSAELLAPGPLGIHDHDPHSRDSSPIDPLVARTRARARRRARLRAERERDRPRQRRRRCGRTRPARSGGQLAAADGGAAGGHRGERERNSSSAIWTRRAGRS